MENEKITLDDILDKFSMFGKYHLQFMFCATLIFSYTAMLGHNYIFAAEETGYRCVDRVFINNTCGTIDGNRCSKWLYDDPQSFMAEFQLACQEWKRTFVGTINCFGFMLGLLIIGPLSDRIGRKKTMILAGVTGAVVGIAKSFAHSYWLYIALEILSSSIGDNETPLYVLNIEIVSTKKKIIFYHLCNTGTFIGGLILPLTAWGTSYWRNYLRIIFSTGFVVLASFVLIDESPRWLLSRKKKDEVLAIVKKMCNKNDVKIDNDFLDRLVVENEDKSVGFITLLRMTIRSRTILKRCIVCIVWWTSATFVYHGLMINSVSLQGNKYINYALIQPFLIFGNFISMYVLHNYKRKNPLIYSSLFAALLCFIQPFLPNGHPWLSVTIYMISSMMSNIYLNITYIYTAELFPTYTRNSMLAFCSSFGRIGYILAPQAPLLLAYWSSLPMLIFGCASLAASLVTFLMPDTADVSLPDTVQEAEDIGDKKKRDVIGVDNIGLSRIE